jgi:hypothetical protein
MDDKLLRDDELNTLLAMASKPVPPDAYTERLVLHLNGLSNRVIDFPAHRKKNSPWIIGLPLAASLVLGFWLGNTGIGSTDVSPDAALVSDNSDDADNTGFEDVTAFIEDSLT